MTTTLAAKLTLREQQAHDAELLTLIRDYAQPTTLAGIFGGFEPQWAREAAERLQIAGKVREDADGRLEAVAKR